MLLVENALIQAALKGSRGSGNWAHTSETRHDKIGGSDPGGGLGKIGVSPRSSVGERREAAQERVHQTGAPAKRTARDYQQAILGSTMKIRTPRAKNQMGIERILHGVLLRTEGRDPTLPKELYIATYGLQYARQTARISGEAEMALRKLNDRAVVRLLSDMAAEDVPINQAGRWLNSRAADLTAGWPKRARQRKATCESIENALIQAALKGSRGSGNWAHTSEMRRGVGRGGSDPGGGLSKIGVSPDSSTQERREAAQERRQARRPANVPQPGQFESLDDARQWFKSRGMETDFTGFTNVEAVNEAAMAMRDILEKYPWLEEAKGPIGEKPGSWDLGFEEGKEFRFLGIGSYSGQDTPSKVPALGGDAFAITDSRTTLVRKVGGPIVYYSPRALNEGEGSRLYAQVGIVARPNATVYGATVHEMGHAVYDVIGARGGKSQYTGSLTYARVSETMRHSLHRVGMTDRMIKKNVSWYATTNDREKFAELFLVLNSTPEQAPTSQAFRRRLGKYRDAFNKELGWDAL